MQTYMQNALPRLSLCMIVKDEEQYLQACLESVKELVDEIIIVDTGSTDKTCEIAQQFTNKIFHFNWGGDFSAARNLSIDMATGDWILVLDADELIAKEEHAKIKALIAREDNTQDKSAKQDKQHDKQDEVVAYFLHQIEYTNDTTLTGFHYITNKNNYTKGFIGFVVVQNAIRLFQNRPWLRFSWKIHESVIESIENFAKSNFLTDSGIFIHHYKNEKPVSIRKEKMFKYLKIGEEQIHLTPNHPKPHYEAGLIYYVLGEYKQALNAFQTALSLTHADTDKQRIMHKLGRCYAQLQDYAHAIEYYKAGIKIKQDSDILAQLGLLYAKLQQDNAAEEHFLNAINETPANILARHNLSVFYIQRGKKQEALKLLHETEQKYPNPFTYNTLGILAAQEKDNQKAMDYFQKGLALAPKSSQIENNIKMNITNLQKFQ